MGDVHAHALPPSGTQSHARCPAVRPGSGAPGEMPGGALRARGFPPPPAPPPTGAPMFVGGRRVQGAKPIWAPRGGAELPATNLAIAGALVLAGPGAISIDRVLGTRPPWWLSLLVIAGLSTGVVVALQREIHEAAERVRAEELREQAEPKGVEAADVDPEVVLSNYSN